MLSEFSSSITRMRRRGLWLAMVTAALSGCGGSQLDAETRARLPHSGPARVSELQVSRQDAAYPVSGLSAAELSRSMHAHAAANWSDEQAVGLTVASIPIEARCQEFSDGGALLDAKVGLSLVVHLPDWQDTARAPAALQQSWQRFLRALRAHEEGHVQLAIEHATALRNQIAQTKPEASCPTFMAKLQERIGAAQARMEQEQADYDEKTQHGIKQGCVL
jgi:predicted secreted Zn-dependent protease